jgi:hypothetical protein
MNPPATYTVGGLVSGLSSGVSTIAGQPGGENCQLADASGTAEYSHRLVGA